MQDQGARQIRTRVVVGSSNRMVKMRAHRNNKIRDSSRHAGRSNQAEDHNNPNSSHAGRNNRQEDHSNRRRGHNSR